MLSVTQRVQTISQPRNGYVPKQLFSFEKYEDYKKLKDIKTALSSIQGLAVDYLTRFIISGNKMKSFEIPLRGAAKVDEAYESNDAIKNIKSLLDNVSGTDRESVINVCKIVCYDAAFRGGLASYQSPDSVSFEEGLYDNVLILTERTLSLLKDIGTITNDSFTFEGGYTKLVSKGDGDYLTSDTLIDLKTSKKDFSSKWSLQLLMYYILGLHSIHSEFLKITKLCIVNPYLNQYCICNINDIDNKSKYLVSRDVLGYIMTYGNDYSKWKEVNGSDIEILKQFLKEQMKKTCFDVNNFGNGIFDITIEDYCTFIRNKEDADFEKRNHFKPQFGSKFRPLFSNTEYIKLIKYDRYFMFVSVSPKGKYSLLHGARLHSLDYSLEYYYDKIKKYAETILSRFSGYWNALKIISEQVQTLYTDSEGLRIGYSKYLEGCKRCRVPKKERMSYSEWYGTQEFNASGRIHGCIVDIDYYNHIYLNPYNGTITPYYAVSMDNKDFFVNVKSLLAVKRPDLLNSSLELIDDETGSSTALVINDTVSTALISKDDTIDEKPVKDFSRDMYAVSNKIKPLKDILDTGWIQVWYDDILDENKLLLEDKYKIKKVPGRAVPGEGVIDESDSSSRKTYIQKGNKTAAIISYRNYKYVDVRFDDGYVMNNVKLESVKKGLLVHPDLKETIEYKKQQKPDSKMNNVKNKYIGMTLKMKCGLKATCIDYENSHNLKVRFEDGVIRTGIRSDHFKEGKVAYVITNNREINKK